MRVRPGKVAPARKMRGGEPTPKPMAQDYTFPAPIRGWVLNESLAMPQPGGALVLDNWICTTTGVKVRGGTSKYATLGASATALFSYKSTTEFFFAATATAIYDITTVADPDVVPTAAVSGQTAGAYSTAQFGTAGGDYLLAANGSDFVKYYDGAVWNPITDTEVKQIDYTGLTGALVVGETLTGATSGHTATILSVNPSSATAGVVKIDAAAGTAFTSGETITSPSGSAVTDGIETVASTVQITGVATTALSHVWSFANRLFFVEKDTKTAWYLPVDSIGGAASSFSLAGIFKKGGSLLFGAAWSLDAGDGLDDKCIFVSTEGEVAVYEGTNPGSAADWRKAGVYDITRPLGPKAVMQAGGDLLVATEAGMVPISQAIRNDAAALSMKSVSAKIAPFWQQEASRLAAWNWEVVKWPAKNIMIVSQPGPDTDEGACLVANLQTGAWSRFTGLQTRCLGFYDDFAFYGNPDGNIYRMESGGSDDGAIYTAAYLGQHDELGVSSRQKTVTMMRPLFRVVGPIVPQVTAQTDYTASVEGSPPSTAPDFGPGIWDVALWGAASWDGGGQRFNTAQWHSVGRTGYTIAPQVQLSYGNVNLPDVELVSIDAQFHVGALVT